MGHGKRIACSSTVPDVLANDQLTQQLGSKGANAKDVGHGVGVRAFGQYR